jgi:uncharacterized protein YjbI with pentapeptide repeats
MTKEETWEKLCRLKLEFGKMPKGKWEIAGLAADLEDGMSGFDLKGADFSGAYLGAANFHGAILCDANFSRAELYEANLSEANLSGANFSGADLYKAYMPSANLSDANLSNADFYYANLSGANLDGANLRESILNEVNLNLANLSRADITGSMFWGVSTTGWKIESIKAQYVYFCQADEVQKEKYRRKFQEGQFEGLFKSLPTIELIFKRGLNPKELSILIAIIEEVQKQNSDLGLKMVEMSTKGFQTRISVETARDEFLEEAGGLIQKAFDETLKKGVSFNVLTQKINEILPPPYNIEIHPVPPQQQTPSIHIQELNFFVNYMKADGSKFEAPVTQAGNLSNVITKNYKAHREESEALFERLMKAFGEYEASMRDTLTESLNRMIEAIQKGKETSKIQNYWEEIKEGVKTGGAVTTIASTLLPQVAKLLGLV